LWGAYKTGYKSGGYSSPTVLSSFYTAENVVFDPEDAEGFEFGIKSTWFDRQVRLNATAYRFEFSDLQVSVFDPATTSFFISNAAESRTTGVEFDAVYQATDALQLYAEFGYNDAKFVSYPGAACYTGQPVGPGECVDDPASGDFGDFQDLSGERLAFAPKWSGSLGFEYFAPVSERWSVLVAGEGVYSGQYVTSTDHQPEAVQDDYWRLRARLGLVSERWEFAVIGRNLTDKQYPVGAARPGAVTRLDQAGGGSLPRTVQARVTFHL
jgi:outer membrane receptor protein involved in Fe transport